jgi:hypothetical protein
VTTERKLTYGQGLSSFCLWYLFSVPLGDGTANEPFLSSLWRWASGILCLFNEEKLERNEVKGVSRAPITAADVENLNTL